MAEVEGDVLGHLPSFSGDLRDDFFGRAVFDSQLNEYHVSLRIGGLEDNWINLLQVDVDVTPPSLMKIQSPQAVQSLWPHDHFIESVVNSLVVVLDFDQFTA